MLTSDELIQNLELSINDAKKVGMMQKAKYIEFCVDDMLVLLKQQNETIKAQTSALVTLKNQIDTLRKKGFGNHG